MKFGKMMGSKLLNEKWGERYSMKADNIEKIISDIDHLPYRAILFDGTWEIGKSYAVNEALFQLAFGLSKIWDKVGQAKEVVQSIANRRLSVCIGAIY